MVKTFFLFQTWRKTPRTTEYHGVDLSLFHPYKSSRAWFLFFVPLFFGCRRDISPPHFGFFFSIVSFSPPPLQPYFPPNPFFPIPFVPSRHPSFYFENYWSSQVFVFLGNVRFSPRGRGFLPPFSKHSHCNLSPPKFRKNPTPPPTFSFGALFLPPGYWQVRIFPNPLVYQMTPQLPPFSSPFSSFLTVQSCFPRFCFLFR